MLTKIVQSDLDLNTSIRLKAFIINSNNEILIANSNGGCQLPGGHLEDNETIKQGLAREIQEETGIVLPLTSIKKPFYKILYNNKNYKAQILYFLIKTDIKPNILNTNYTEEEIKNNFKIKYININEFENYIHKNILSTKISINKVIDKEIIEAFNQLKHNI